MALPCAGVPEPAGKPFPSGKTEIFQPAASASLTGFPNFGASAAEAEVIMSAVAAVSKAPITVDAHACAGSARCPLPEISPGSSPGLRPQIVDPPSRGG